MFLHVTEAKYLSEYKIEIVFNDGRKGVADLRDAFHGGAFEILKDIGLFSQLTVDKDLETIVWPNGLDFAPEFLYYKAFKDVPELQEQFKKWGYGDKSKQAA